jgi:LonC protease-like protein
MTAINELQPEALYTRCKPETFKFETTAELQGIAEIPGHSRAADAVRFGLGIQHDGYNIFALGPLGTGKQFLIERSLGESAGSRAAPPDLCYVNNFSEPGKPSLLVLPAGAGSSLKKDLKEVIDEVRSALPGVFESEEYQAKLNLAAHANSFCRKLESPRWWSSTGLRSYRRLSPCMTKHRPACVPWKLPEASVPH